MLPVNFILANKNAQEIFTEAYYAVLNDKLITTESGDTKMKIGTWFDFLRGTS